MSAEVTSAGRLAEIEPLADHQTKGEMVYGRLREAIATGTLAPGTRLAVREVAETLGVSESPVREALRRLSGEGYIELEPYQKAVVTQLYAADFEDIFFVRTILEVEATREAANVISLEQIEELQSLVEDMEEAIEQGEPARFSQYNREFHLVIFRVFKNERLVRMILRLWRDSDRARAIFAAVPDQARVSNEEHKRILDALRAGDADTAAEEMKRHRQRVTGLFMEHIGDRTGSGPSAEEG